MNKLSSKQENKVNRVNRVIFLLSTLSSLLGFLFGCVSFKQYVEPQDVSQGQITIFLKGPDKTSIDISFDLTAVNIMKEDGTYREVSSEPIAINSLDITGNQILLGERYLPDGRYKKLQFAVKQAFLKRDNRIAHLALPPEGIEVDIDITVSKNQNTSLFTRWDADASIVDGYLFNPIFSVKGQVPELSSLLIYITNEGSDNVSVINRQTGEIVATIMVGKKPRGIATSPGKEHAKVYVVNSGSNSISVIDPTTHRVDVEIPIRFGRVPESIAVFRTSLGKELIFVTNYGSNNVSIFDGSSYQEIDKINVGDGPIAIAVDPPAENLSATRFLSFDEVSLIRKYRENFFNVYVVNRNSKDVSIIKMDKEKTIIDEVTDISVEWRPVALAVDYPRGKVYVANFNYDNLSVIDILQIIRGNKAGSVSEIKNVGTSVIGVVADPDFDRLYLLRESSGEILIVRPFTEALGALKTTMVPVVGTIAVGTSPSSLLLDPEGRKIYVVNTGSNTVSVVDKATMTEEEIIPVGRKPYGIAMFP